MLPQRESQGRIGLSEEALRSLLSINFSAEKHPACVRTQDQTVEVRPRGQHPDASFGPTKATLPNCSGNPLELILPLADRNVSKEHR